MSVLEIVGSVVGIIVGVSAISMPIARLFARSLAEDVMRKHVEAQEPHGTKYVALQECRREHQTTNMEMRAILTAINELKIEFEHLRTLIQKNGREH